MAEDDRKALRQGLMTAAAAVLDPQPFDLRVDESGIALQLDANWMRIATVDEIASGKLGDFSERVCKAAGVTRVTPSPVTSATFPERSENLAALTALADVPRETPRRRKPQITQISEQQSPITLSRMPAPKWVSAAAEMTGTIDVHAPEPHPVCGPPRLTRRAQSILEEIQARHRE